jgi:general transcription factor 3C polypeptide 3 (transcription factor C subunit 4)
VIYGIALCHLNLKDLPQAQEAFQWGRFCWIRLMLVVDVQPENLEARLKLANVLEDMGQRSEALEMVSEGE